MPLRLRGNLLAFSLLAIATGCSAIRSQTSKEFLPPAPDGKQWKLAWHDEFDGQQLDETKWNRLGDWKRRDGYWVKADVKLTEEIGTWGGDIQKASLPDYCEVDYVRVYDAKPD